MVLALLACATVLTRTSESSATLIGVPAGTRIGILTGARVDPGASAAGFAGCCPAGGRSFSVCPDAQSGHRHARVTTANSLKPILCMTIPLFARRITTPCVTLESRAGSEELAQDEGWQIPRI